TSAKVPLSPNQTATIDFTLTADSAVGNMIRNGALASLWLGPLQPDAWYRVRSRAVAANWEGELLPLKEGTTCRLSVAWQENAAGQVIVRLRKTADFNQLTIELKPLQPGETELSFPATGDTGFA
ncbi:MAG: hypothetical protein ABIP20_02365, partial [Chthoniobacteraceae bacterium]